jgi:hypothetical protein
MNAIGTWSSVDPRFLLDPFEPAGDAGDVTGPAEAARGGVEAGIEGGAQSPEGALPEPRPWEYAQIATPIPGSRVETDRDRSGPIGWPTRSVTESQSNILYQVLYQVVALVRHQSGNRVGSGFVVEGSTAASRKWNTRDQSSGSDPITRLVADDRHKVLRIEDLRRRHRSGGPPDWTRLVPIGLPPGEATIRGGHPTEGLGTVPAEGGGLVRPKVVVTGHARRTGRGAVPRGSDAGWYGRRGPRTTGGGRWR